MISTQIQTAKIDEKWPNSLAIKTQATTAQIIKQSKKLRLPYY